MSGIHLKKKLIILIILLISRIIYSLKSEDDEYEYKYETEYEYKYESKYKIEYQDQYEDQDHYTIHQPVFLTFTTISTTIIIDPTITNVITTLESKITDMSTTILIDPTITNLITTLKLTTTDMSTTILFNPTTTNVITTLHLTKTYMSTTILINPTTTNVITTLELITTDTSTIKETFTIEQCPVGSSFLCSNTNECVDLSTDINNCGLCNNVCQYANAVPQCSNSQCGIQLCYPGFSNCNNDILDGCEVNIQTDKENCGACSNVCSQTQVCLNGVCAISCSAIGDCAAINFENVGCVSTASTGTGPSNVPYTPVIPGSDSITASQCYDTCVNRFAQTLKFFTLSVDTAGLSINTFCSCYTDSNNVGFDQIPASTCNNNYGVTTNGAGSWYLYSVI